ARGSVEVGAPAKGGGDAAAFDELDVDGQLWAGRFPSVGIAEFALLRDFVADDQMAAAPNRNGGDGKPGELQVVVAPVSMKCARDIVGSSDGHRAAAVEDAEVR